MNFVQHSCLLETSVKLRLGHVVNVNMNKEPARHH